MIPTEHEYTVATQAAAKRYHEDMVRAASMTPSPIEVPAWDDLDAFRRQQTMEAVLPIVNAAISALPDRRADAWPEIRALHDGSTFTADEIYEVLRGNRR